MPATSRLSRGVLPCSLATSLLIDMAAVKTRISLLQGRPAHLINEVNKEQFLPIPVAGTIGSFHPRGTISPNSVSEYGSRRNPVRAEVLGLVWDHGVWDSTPVKPASASTFCAMNSVALVSSLRGRARHQHHEEQDEKDTMPHERRQCPGERPN